MTAPRIFTLPKAHHVHDAVMDDGAVIRIRRHGNPDGPRLALAHGNGFAIDAYFPFWRLLSDDYDLVLYDQRNHGWNPRHEVSRHDLPHFVSDLQSLRTVIDDAFGDKPTVGVFHSISAITAIWHALDHGWQWAGLALFDPPLIPSPGHPLYEDARTFELGLSEWAASRPERFADVKSLAERFAASKSLSRWVPGAHELMARTITREDPTTGERTLRCPPLGESRVYKTNAGLDLCPYLGGLAGPLMVVGSDPEAPHALAPSRGNRAMHAEHGYDWASIKGTSHMLQVERPDACADTLKAFLGRIGFSQ